MENNPEKRKPGRPYSGGRQPQRHFRANDGEWAEIRAAAAKVGKSASSWIREVMLRAARRGK